MLPFPTCQVHHDLEHSKGKVYTYKQRTKARTQGTNSVGSCSKIKQCSIDCDVVFYGGVFCHCHWDFGPLNLADLGKPCLAEDEVGEEHFQRGRRLCTVCRGVQGPVSGLPVGKSVVELLESAVVLVDFPS